ncbi:hypothetical protein RRG08_033339 [Elysia crispata]|uniref:PLAC domain-containing protein n=1 Tax=Elysia crispata TaxID=231223 RepID=A0AAE0Z7M2_9GAST|nr:hypothetical protein RRG08_033339 [Elysia crispata]
MTMGFLFWTFLFSLQYLVQQSVTGQAVVDSERCPQCSVYTCRRISGIYTVPVLTPGTYNSVVEIPASACSINITELAASDNYIALRTNGGDGIINSKWALGQPGLYFGAGVRFSYDRSSGSCRGSCIHSLGPTTEEVLVEILYYNKNPGIVYSFTIPNTVAFDPLERISPASSSPPTPLSSAEVLPKVRFAQRQPVSLSSRRTSRSRGRSRTRTYRRTSGRLHGRHAEDETDSLREYYPDPELPRSEGRPDVTSAAEGGAPPQALRQGTSYGTHTLGGRGLSYTYGVVESPGSSPRARSKASARASRRRGHKQKSGRRVIERYISGSSTKRGARPASTSQYASAIRRQDTPGRRGSKGTSNYVRTPRYQSLSAPATSYKENTAGSFERSNRYSRGRLRVGTSAESNRYRWKISGLSACSHTCGGGFQTTTIVCVSLGSRRQVVVTPENCADYRRPRQQTVACNKSPCSPAWESDPWSACSVTCGSGTQTRKVECRQRVSSTLTLMVSADDCGLEKKPAMVQQCGLGLCSRWSVGPWSVCEECGGGESVREVRCVDIYDSSIPGNYCTEAKPPTTKSCDTKPCTVDWWLSDWTPECSVSCGDGIRTRKALCLTGQGSITDSKLCEKLELPVLEEQCRADTGCRGSWFTGTWGKCSKDCGEGVRFRRVICVRRTSGSRDDQHNVTSDSDCDSAAKPESEEKCTRANCEAKWFTGPWGQCSVTCGDGYSSRDVRCIIDERDQGSKSKDNTRRDAGPRESTSCVSSLRPDTRKLCSLVTCPLEPRYQRTDRYEPSPHDSSAHFEDRIREYKASVFVGGNKVADGYQPDNSNSYNEAEDDTDSDFEDDDDIRPRPSFSDRYRNLSSADRRTEIRHYVPANRCSDKITRCLMAVQARLCSYPYYQHVCCLSCRKHATKH